MFNVLLDFSCLQGHYGILIYALRSKIFFNLYGKSQQDQMCINSPAIKHLMYADTAAANQVWAKAHAWHTLCPKCMERINW